MKLFKIYPGLGIATAVAKDVFGVLVLIAKHPDLRYRFLDKNDELLPSKTIIQYIEEIPGYTVEGEVESIINCYIE